MSKLKDFFKNKRHDHTEIDIADIYSLVGEAVAPNDSTGQELRDLVALRGDLQLVRLNASLAKVCYSSDSKERKAAEQADGHLTHAIHFINWLVKALEEDKPIHPVIVRQERGNPAVRFFLRSSKPLAFLTTDNLAAFESGFHGPVRVNRKSIKPEKKMETEVEMSSIPASSGPSRP